MRTLAEQTAILEHLLSIAKERKEAGENEWLEFKTNIGESRCSITYERVGNYLSGLANAACIKDKAYGYLVLGIEDGTWKSCGTNLLMSNAQYNGQDYELWLRRNLNPMINFEVEEFLYMGKHVVLFIIPAASAEPVAFKKEEYIRIGSNLTKLKDFPDYKRKIFNSQNDWSAQILPNVSISDLDDNAIRRARELYANKHEDLRGEMQGWDDVTFLNKAKIIRQGKITNTAIVLLGKAESEVLISPSVAKIRWILKDSSGDERDYLIKSCPFVLSVEEIYARIRNLKYRYINPYFQSLFPDEIDTYEPYVIREALNNAIAHQDYREGGMINVVEYEDRLVFSNKGGFIPSNIRHVLSNDAPEERYRNKYLAQAMVELKMVDTIGSGIRRMFNFQRKRLFPAPDYDFSGNRVQVCICGKIVDINYSMLLSQHKDLNLEEIEMLNRLQLGKPLSDNEIDYLRKRKLVEGRKPNIYLAKSVAQAAGRKIAYTMAKGFDDTYYRDLIVKALKEHGQLKRQDFEDLLLDKLPAVLTQEQKKRKVGNLLLSLRMKGVIKAGEEKEWSLCKL